MKKKKESDDEWVPQLPPKAPKIKKKAKRKHPSRFTQRKLFEPTRVNVVFSGDRNCIDVECIRDLIETQLDPKRHILIQGGCTGVDSIVKEVGEDLGFEVITENADWDRYGLAAGPIRNQLMLDRYDPVHVYLFHDNIEYSKGTKNMRNLCIAGNYNYSIHKTK